MLSNRLIFIAIVLFASCAPKEQKQENVREFFVEDKPLVLNGNVKQVFITYEDTRDKSLNNMDFTKGDLDKKGDVIEIISGFHGARLLIRYITSYGKNNHKVQVTGYLSLPKRKFLESKYANDTSSIINSERDSAEKVVEIYKYNKDNHITERFDQLNKSHDTFSYDEAGDMVEYDEDVNPRYSDKTIYKYDEQHHLIQSDHYAHNNCIEEIKYEYKSFDSHNNWIKMIAHSNYMYEKKSMILTRKITYY